MRAEDAGGRASLAIRRERRGDEPGVSRPSSWRRPHPRGPRPTSRQTAEGERASADQLGHRQVAGGIAEPLAARTANRAAERSGTRRRCPRPGARPGHASRTSRGTSIGIQMPAALDTRPLLAAASRDRRAAPSARGQSRGERAFARQHRRQAAELHAQDGREHVGRDEAAALGHPRVLVDLAAEERRAVGALLAKISARCRSASLTADERSAFAADDVLRAVKAEAAEVADRPERPAVPARAEPVRGILDDAQAMTVRQCRGWRSCRTRVPRSGPP